MTEMTNIKRSIEMNAGSGSTKTPNFEDILGDMVRVKDRCNAVLRVAQNLEQLIFGPTVDACDKEKKEPTPSSYFARWRRLSGDVDTTIASIEVAVDRVMNAFDQSDKIDSDD